MRWIHGTKRSSEREKEKLAGEIGVRYCVLGCWMFKQRSYAGLSATAGDQCVAARVA